MTGTTALFFSRENTPPLRGVLLQDGSAWFVATDALALIGCVNSPSSMSRFDASEWRQIGAANPFGLHLQTRVISERGLGKLVLNGRKPDAAAAAQWVFQHVIPATYSLRPN